MMTKQNSSYRAIPMKVRKNTVLWTTRTWPHENSFTLCNEITNNNMETLE